jgi:hypothetical protein
MKTALDLPDDLVREVKMHAVRSGRKLNSAIADLLRVGLDASAASCSSAPIARDPLTALPVVVCSHPAAPGAEMTPERVARVLVRQEAEWRHDAGRQ